MIRTDIILREQPQWLASEVGLVPKTYDLPVSLAVTVGRRKIIKSGTLFPANGADALGLVTVDYDVTDIPAEQTNIIGAVYIQGTFYNELLPVPANEAAIDAFKEQGLYFIPQPVTTRPSETL